MTVYMKKNALVVGLAALIFAFPAHSSVNRSVKVDDGTTASGASSVNGSVTVGIEATVTGNVSTVNGAIRIGERSVIERAETVNGSIKISDGVRSNDVETVNGAIRIGENATIDGEVTAVNGQISLGQGSSVSGDLSNVNGDIGLEGSQVGEDVSTVNGDVELSDGAAILGNIVVEKPRGWNFSRSGKPKIVIGPGCRVDGVIRLEREVDLYISDSAQVGGVEGEMDMGDAVIFSGNRP